MTPNDDTFFDDDSLLNDTISADDGDNNSLPDLLLYNQDHWYNDIELHHIHNAIYSCNATKVRAGINSLMKPILAHHEEASLHDDNFELQHADDYIDFMDITDFDMEHDLVSCW